MRLSDELRRLAVGVSRSFALSLNALPGAVRDSLALAYMIARATDTVADAEGPFGDMERLDLLGRFTAHLRRLADPAEAGQAGFECPALERFAERIGERSECQLLLRVPELMALAGQLPPFRRVELAGVLAKIIEGQRMDVIAFPRGSGAFRSFGDEETLDRYTYLVAGCVGGFWTRICLADLPGYARVSPRWLVDEGIRFGRGLQLVNVLRDRPEDLSKGRCYIPLLEQGRSPSVEELAEASRPWFERARTLLGAGNRYIAGIRGVRMRFAVALPLLLGQRTLELVERAGTMALRTKLKIARSEVRRLIFAGMWRAFRSF